MRQTEKEKHKHRRKKLCDPERLEQYSHKPRNTWSHQKLEVAKIDAPL